MRTSQFPQLVCLIFFGQVSLVTAPAKSADDSQTPPSRQSSKLANPERKVETIYLPKIDFKNTNLDDALQILSRESQKADPEHVGVYFTLPPKTGEYSAHPITLSMDHLPLVEAIRYTLQLANPNLSYRIENNTISLKYVAPGKPILKRFLAADRVFRLAKDGDDAKKSTEAQKQLWEMGVTFPTGTSATYITATNTLVVVNSPGQMERIEEMFATGAKAKAPQDRIRLEGDSLRGSFLLNEYHEWRVLHPDHQWDDGAQFGLKVDLGDGPIYGKINIEKGVKNPHLSPGQNLRAMTTYLEQSYKHPIGKITGFVQVGENSAPILCFKGTGGDETFVKLYFRNRYAVYIEFGQDLPQTSFSRNGFTTLVKEVGNSFRLEER